ncbi:MAG: hypothetical protein KGZ96_05075 [Clostridia bacterium]|jgi:hypothetical protein|nr:hypothetical protein [Clostridia bacterium]
MYNYHLTGECPLTNTPECPCVLANIRECPVCNHLQGEEFCDCQWDKSCVYLNYKFEKKSFAVNSSEGLYPVKIVSITKDCYLVYLVGSIESLSNISPLTKAYLWPTRQLRSYRFPVVVLRTYLEEGIVVVAFQASCTSDKSMFLHTDAFFLECFQEPVILGLKSLLDLEKQKVFIYANAYGQLLLEQLATSWLLPLQHQLTIYCDSPLSSWAARKLKKLPVNIYYSNTTPLHTLLVNTAPAYCCTLGNRAEHKKIACLLSDLRLNIPQAVSLFD